MIEIDGSYGEGGGQIVRTSVALSAVTGKSVLIKKIRQGRPKPGLAAQHAQAIRALGQICNAEIKGAEPGSSEVLFCPQEICGGSRRVEIGTAGSVTLLMQCLLPALLHAEKRTSLQVQGGTDVQWSPSVDYFRNVFLPALSFFGGRAGLQLLRRGYYPRGQGEVLLEVEPSHLKPAHISYEPFNPAHNRIMGISHCSNLPQHVAERQAASAIERLQEAGYEAEILQETGQEPDPATLAVKMEMPEEKIRKILKISKEPISMETPIGDDDDSHLGDFIEDQAGLAPSDSALYASLREATKDVLDSLTPREAKVLRMRFGIEMNTDHTLEEVGKQFDVTRERIRQIEAKALRKLRHPSRSEKLRSFLEGE